MKTLITGASGYIGARLKLDLEQSHEVLGTFFSHSFANDLVKMDVNDLASVQAVCRKFQPDLIVHVAAFPAAANNPDQEEILQTLNYQGVDDIIAASNECGARLVFISSAASVQYNNSYGASKAYGEEACRRVVAGSLIVRPHVVFGYSPNMTQDRSFNRLLKNIFLHTPATYDTSWKFQPTYVGHISQVIAEYAAGRIPNGLIDVAIQTLKSKYEIGRDLLANFDLAVTPVDNHSDFPVIELDLRQFAKLQLPISTYEELIAKMTEEIRAIGDKYPLKF